MNGFADRMNKLTSEGKAWEEAILQFALELGIEVPEIKTLMESGKSYDEATRIVSNGFARERQLSAYRSERWSLREYRPSPSSLWYLVPFFFGLLGGIVGYVGVKSEDKGLANNLLNLGIIMTTVIDVGISYFIFFVWLPSLFY